MRTRTWFFTMVMISCLLAALSTGGQMYWLFFLVMACMGVLALISALLAWGTLSITYVLSSPQVVRGNNLSLQVNLRHSAPLPVAPVLLRFFAPDARLPLDVRVAIRPFRRTQCRQTFPCPHVGVYPTGLTHYGVSDVFGLFLLKRKPGVPPVHATVLPSTFPVRPLLFSPGESGNEAITRAKDDATSPADVRAYQYGDELKRVHWKLSMRKQELMIRRFEEPEHPDALILMNCAPPTEDEELAYFLRDALCETAASLAVDQVKAGHIVRMPLLGANAREVACENISELPALLDALAHAPFDGTDRFERVLELETRRMRRTGGTVVITSRMDSQVADMLMRIRRMGPRTRLYYVYDGVLPEETDMLLLRLEKHDIEVETLVLMSGVENEQ
ncbi:MAG: DUF58 domain-containing protein [Clostridia bacterium]|nr:DUF58 domain-containing protein [Clostridia bacterium]